MLPRNFFFGLYSSFAWGCLCIAFCDLEQKRLHGRAGAAPRTPMVKMGPMRTRGMRERTRKVAHYLDGLTY